MNQFFCVCCLLGGYLSDQEIIYLSPLLVESVHIVLAVTLSQDLPYHREQVYLPLDRVYLFTLLAANLGQLLFEFEFLLLELLYVTQTLEHGLYFSCLDHVELRQFVHVVVLQVDLNGRYALTVRDVQLSEVRDGLLCQSMVYFGLFFLEFLEHRCLLLESIVYCSHPLHKGIEISHFGPVLLVHGGQLMQVVEHLREPKLELLFGGRESHALELEVDLFDVVFLFASTGEESVLYRLRKEGEMTHAYQEVLEVLPTGLHVGLIKLFDHVLWRQRRDVDARPTWIYFRCSTTY